MNNSHNRHSALGEATVLKNTAASLAIAGMALIASAGLAQGPSSRPVFSGPAIMMDYGDGRVQSEETQIPIPDLFRTEAPFVERNVRLDYRGANNLQEPLADESRFFTEVSYSFTDRLGISFSAPLLIRDNFGAPDTSGFGDLEAGVRYVWVGYENEDPFKLAFGLNVVAPTGNVGQELGEGQTFIEPEVLLFRRVADRTFIQSQFSVGLPTGRSNLSSDFGWNFGVGHVYTDFAYSDYFKFPTAVIELNGATAVGGINAGATVVDVTPGLRWSIGSKTYGGVALSVPMTGPREFDAQLIFSLVYRYGPADQEGRDPTSSRAYF